MAIKIKCKCDKCKKKEREKIQSDIETIVKNDLSILEHKNNNDIFSTTNHLTIVGGVRRVEYYPTTGTVYANRVQGKYKVARGKGVYDAIRIAKEGR